MAETAEGAAETQEAAQAPEQMPPIVEQAFGKQEKAEPAGEPEAPGQPPEQPKTESKGDKRFLHLMSKLRDSAGEIGLLKEKLAKFEGADPGDAKAAAEKMAAQLRLETAEERQRQAENDLAMERLAEAFPDEAQRDEFIELAGEYAGILKEYAPKACECVAGSENPYKLEKALYDVLAGDACALRDFLNYTFPMQKKCLQGLEAYLKQGGAIIDGKPQAPHTPDPSKLPKDVPPSDSGASGGGQDAYEAALARIAENNRRL